MSDRYASYYRLIDHYASYYRLIDHRGVLHLSTAAMQYGAALCGNPPAGNQWADPASSFYPPYRVTKAYVRVCAECNEMAGL